MTIDLTPVLLICAAAVVAVAGIVWIIRGHRGSGMASLTAFHDFQPKDRQEAIEYVIEERAGKKMAEQESGEKQTPGEPECPDGNQPKRADPNE